MESRRAAALEAALAAEVEARQRDLKSHSAEAARLQSLLTTSDGRWQQERDALISTGEAAVRSLETQLASQTRAAEESALALRQARHTLTSGAHAQLMLRLAVRGVSTEALRGCLYHWLHAAWIMDHSREAANLREEVTPRR